MKKLIGIGALLLVAACQPKATVGSPAPTPVSGSGPGAATPAAALTAFMAAAKSEDLQGIGAVWGDADGLARDKISRQELEMRTYYIAKCVRNDSYKVISEQNVAGERHVLAVQITKAAPGGVLTKTSNFTTARTKGGRWLVEKFDTDPLTAICQLG